MDPLNFNRDDLAHLTLEIFLEVCSKSNRVARPVQIRPAHGKALKRSQDSRSARTRLAHRAHALRRHLEGHAGRSLHPRPMAPPPLRRSRILAPPRAPSRVHALGDAGAATLLRACARSRARPRPRADGGAVGGAGAAECPGGPYEALHPRGPAGRPSVRLRARVSGRVPHEACRAPILCALTLARIRTRLALRPTAWRAGRWCACRLSVAPPSPAPAHTHSLQGT